MATATYLQTVRLNTPMPRYGLATKTYDYPSEQVTVNGVTGFFLSAWDADMVGKFLGQGLSRPHISEKDFAVVSIPLSDKTSIGIRFISPQNTISMNKVFQSVYLPNLRSDTPIPGPQHNEAVQYVRNLQERKVGTFIPTDDVQKHLRLQKHS